jgi:hypothetical protein
MSKKKPAERPEDQPQVTSLEDIQRFAMLLDYFMNKCNCMVEEMKKHRLPSVNRSSKRHERIKEALNEYVGGLERALEKVTLDIHTSESTRLKVADTRSPYESSSEKKDKK